MIVGWLREVFKGDELRFSDIMLGALRPPKKYKEPDDWRVELTALVRAPPDTDVTDG